MCCHAFECIGQRASGAAQAAKQLYATRVYERQEIGSLVFNSFVFMQVRTQSISFFTLPTLHCDCDQCTVQMHMMYTHQRCSNVLDIYCR